MMWLLVLVSLAAAQTCMTDLWPSCDGCTANDVRISSIALLGAPISCTIGAQTTIDIKVQWVATANGRYNVAAYLARDGGNALTGQCNEFILQPVATGAQVVVFGNSTNPSSGPFLNLNNDNCGDIDTAPTVWQAVTGVTVTCRDQDKNGIADVSGCCSWDNNRNNVCNGLATAACGTPSKCRCDSILNIAGLTTCLQSQPSCSGHADSPNSCQGGIFSALFSVQTLNTSTSTTFPPGAVTTGYVYSRFFAAPNTALAFAFFAPGTPVSSPGAIVRQDVLSPCSVQRQVYCGATLSSCQSIAETQPLPRLFHEAGDTDCGGVVCSGARYTPTQCTHGYRKTGATLPTQIAFIWTLADRRTPCAAETVDGTLFQFYASNGVTPGVINIAPTPPAPLLQPGNSVPFNFTASGNCVFPQCTTDVEAVFVIDEQAGLSAAGYANVLTYVANLIATFNTASPRTRFGLWFTGSSNSTTPPLILTQNTQTANNLVTNVLLPHLQSPPPGGTNFVTAISAAVNKFWPSSAAANGVKRELYTVVGGPDVSGGNYAVVQALLQAANIESWAMGVENGASQNALMAGITSTGTYQHFQGVFNSSNLQLSVGAEGQVLCPQSNLCGTACRGFCTCSSPGVNTCACPTTCVNANNCTLSSCQNATVGCTAQPRVCNDNSACSTDSCNPTTGCVFTSIAGTCTGQQTCVNSTGCVRITDPCVGAGAGNCTTNKCFTQSCVAGFCVPGTPTNCDDNNACTVDTCDPLAPSANGCVNRRINCTQTSSCRSAVCVDGPGTQPNCQLGPALNCNDGDSCTLDACIEGLGCVYTNYSCPASNISCSFPSGCLGAGASPQCLITNFTCGGLSAAAAGGIAAGVIAAIAIAAVIAALLVFFLSKKGYDYYQAQSAFSSSSLQNSAAYKGNANAGQMPDRNSNA